MPKRKLVSLRRRSYHRIEIETESDLSSDSGILTKRIKEDLSRAKGKYNSASDQENPLLSSEEDNEKDGYASEYFTLDLQCSNETDTERELINNSQYDGYQNFINSFQFFSDEESCETDSQFNVQQYSQTKKKEKRISKAAKWYQRKSQMKMKVDWQDQSQYAYFNEDNIRQQRVNEHVRVLALYLKNLECVFMDHPSSVPIVGYLTVTLIAGRASIQGYALEINKPVTVFSQKQTGILSVTSHFCEEELIYSMQKNVKTKLIELMPGISEDCMKDYIRQNMKYNSSVFILQNCILSPPLQFLQLYSPFAVSFESKNNSINNALKTKYTAFTENEENILTFGPVYEEIFTTIHKHLLKINLRKPEESEAIETSDLNLTSSDNDLENGRRCRNISGFRILITGPKKAGKSTMLRYLVNRFLSKYPQVFYLDTDPGQSEFTPPGSLSLVKVTEPVFGPPYSHIRKPLKSIFTGTVTPETSPGMHKRSISKMISYFKVNYPDSILVVNTIGWLTGVGSLIHQHLKDSLLPAVEINLSPHLNALNIYVEGRALKCTVGFERNAATSTKQGDHRPQDLREWALLAYLGRCQAHYLQPLTVNALRPVCISWENIAVYNFNKRLILSKYYEALNGSVVALCYIKESFMLCSTSPDYPHLTSTEDPDNECLGYGLVRAVDESNHLLYIVTPITPETLNESVNAILSGNILVPRDIIYAQEILNVELDYTDVSREGKTELRRPIRKRSRGHSSKDRI